MLEAHRFAARRLSDLDRVGEARFAFGGRGKRISRVKFEFRVVEFDKDGERAAGRREIRLVHVALDRAQRIENGAVNLVFVRLAFDIRERARREIDILPGRGFAGRSWPGGIGALGAGAAAYGAAGASGLAGSGDGVVGACAAGGTAGEGAVGAGADGGAAGAC